MDTRLLHAINSFTARHDGFEDVIGGYVGLSEILFVALLAGLFVLSGAHRVAAARRGVVAAGASAALALAIAQVIAGLVDRPRPYVADPSGLHLFASRSPDPSFPSDHATAAFAVALAIWLRNRRWGALALVMAAVLALGRVAVGVHYPSDVVAGAALGMAAALALWVPPMRRPLHRLADAISGIWDAALARLRLRRSPA